MQRSRELCLFPARLARGSHSAPLAGGRARTQPRSSGCPAWSAGSRRRRRPGAGPGPDDRCASGVGPRRPGVSVRPAMGEAGPGPGAGPGPREPQEPEEDEAAAPGRARGGRAGPRGGIRVLKVRRGPRPPPLPATRWDGGGESAAGRRGLCPPRPWSFPARRGNPGGCGLCGGGRCGAGSECGRGRRRC